MFSNLKSFFFFKICIISKNLNAVSSLMLIVPEENILGFFMYAQLYISILIIYTSKFRLFYLEEWTCRNGEWSQTMYSCFLLSKISTCSGGWPSICSVAQLLALNLSFSWRLFCSSWMYYLVLTQTLTYIGRGTLNWGVAYIRLVCEHVCGDNFLIGID